MKRVIVIEGPHKGVASNHFAVHGNAIEIQIAPKKRVIVHKKHCEVWE